MSLDDILAFQLIVKSKSVCICLSLIKPKNECIRIRYVIRINNGTLVNTEKIVL